MSSQSEMQITYAHKHVPALDGLRGLAVLVIFVHHLGGGAHSTFAPLQFISKLIVFGWSGVTLFFVLSGYLITGILWKSRGQVHWWKTFLVRRALRIFPLYYFVLGLICATLLYQHAPFRSWQTLFTFSLYLQNLPFPQTFVGVWFQVGHLWSLAVEEQFYLFWPIVLMAAPTLKRGRQICMLVIALSLAFRLAVWFATQNHSLQQAMPARAGELAVGSWLALSLLETPSRLLFFRKIAPFALLAGAGFILCCQQSLDFQLYQSRMYVLGLVGTSLMAAALLVLSISGGRTTRVLQMRWIRHLGTISYGIYVYHIFFLDQFSRLTELFLPHTSFTTERLARFAVAAGLTLAVSELSFHLLERPFITLKDRLAPASLQPVNETLVNEC